MIILIIYKITFLIYRLSKTSLKKETNLTLSLKSSSIWKVSWTVKLWKTLMTVSTRLKKQSKTPEMSNKKQEIFSISHFKTKIIKIKIIIIKYKRIIIKLTWLIIILGRLHTMIKHSKIIIINIKTKISI